MSDYAETNGCTYLDLFKLKDDVGIDMETDFRDAGHLNNSEAIKTRGSYTEWHLTHDKP